LATPAFSLIEWSGHQIAMVCTGLLGAAPYYRGPYDGGALYFAVEGIQLPAVEGMGRISNLEVQL
jgi:hypothetical protein